VKALLQLPPLAEHDLLEMHRYRLARLREQMHIQGVALCVLCNPISLRYAVNFTEYQLFQAHIPTSYLLVPAAGPVHIYGASQRHYALIDQYHPSRFITPFDGGLELAAHAYNIVEDIDGFLAELGLATVGKGLRPTVAIERFSPELSKALLAANYPVMDAECIVEAAKVIKSATEIACIKQAIAVAEYGIEQMREALIPGISENQLWSILHQVNIAHGGDWLEGKMLASGYRTNPWLQESSHKIIEYGEMVAFDTDLIGPHGYLADISRSWICGDAKPNLEQRDAYRHAWDEIQHNMALIKPGVSFSELVENAFMRHDKYRAKRYVCAFHGAGLSDEHPKIYYAQDHQFQSDNQLLQENMVLCVESYSGADHAREGVKLEEMVRVSANGFERLTQYPFERALID